MGEEYGERAPFRFFTDHVDSFIADATREGRRREFEHFTAFSGEDVPDPQDPQTFEASKLTREEDAGLRAFYAELLALRRELPRELRAEVDGGRLRMTRGDVTVEVDFTGPAVEVRSGVGSTEPPESGAAGLAGGGSGKNAA